MVEDSRRLGSPNSREDAWSAPLILIGLAFFVVGLLAGLVSSMPGMVRLRMENGRLKRELRVAREAPVVVEQPPMPPLI